MGNHQLVRSPRWRVVLVCFLAQNLAMGLAFGSFGPMLSSTEEHFGVSRSTASTGMSVILLAIGALSPVLGNVLQRIPVRFAMMAGAFASAVGYWGLAVLTSFHSALFMFGLIGVGVCLLAILGPTTLVSRWFTSNRAKMLGVVNLPILLFLTPYVVAQLTPVYGRFSILAVIGTCFLLMIPLFLWLVERPSEEATRLVGSRTSVSCAESDREDGDSNVFKKPAFWLLSLGIGVSAGAGTAFVVHAVSFGMEKDMSLQASSLLQSVYSAAGIVGTLLFGWLADRNGAVAALVASVFCQSILWASLPHLSGTLLYVMAASLGMCVVPLVMLHGAALSELFGANRVSHVMGYSYSIKLPFLFCFAPAFALLFERFGNYHPPFLATAALLAMAGVCFCFTVMIQRRGKQVIQAAHDKLALSRQATEVQ